MTTSFSVYLLFGLAAVFVIAGLAFFWRPRWIMAWLKGMCAFALLALGVAIALFAFNLRNYQSLDQLTAIGTLRSVKLGPQKWQVTLNTAGQGARSFELAGDQWQVDARILQFDGLLRWLGLGPMYQLDRISGRYVALEQEQNAQRTVYGLGHTGGIDIWKLDREVGLPFVAARYGNSVFMPLKDGARYTISLSLNGLVAKPDNAIARKAVSDWF